MTSLNLMNLSTIILKKNQVQCKIVSNNTLFTLNLRFYHEEPKEFSVT